MGLTTLKPYNIVENELYFPLNENHLKNYREDSAHQSWPKNYGQIILHIIAVTKKERNTINHNFTIVSNYPEF